MITTRVRYMTVPTVRCVRGMALKIPATAACATRFRREQNAPDVSKVMKMSNLKNVCSLMLITSIHGSFLQPTCVAVY